LHLIEGGKSESGHFTKKKKFEGVKKPMGQSGYLNHTYFWGGLRLAYFISICWGFVGSFKLLIRGFNLPFFWATMDTYKCRDGNDSGTYGPGLLLGLVTVQKWKRFVKIITKLP
jgi:hypothetical protein